GLDGWAQVPRLVAPTIILILVLATIPALHRRTNGPARGSFAAAAIGVLALGASLMMLTSVRDQPLLAQETPSPAPIDTPTTPPTGPAETAPATPEPAQTTPEAVDPLTPEAPAGAPDAGVETINYRTLEVGVDWPAYGGTHRATRYSPLDQIT